MAKYRNKQIKQQEKTNMTQDMQVTDNQEPQVTTGQDTQVQEPQVTEQPETVVQVQEPTPTEATVQEVSPVAATPAPVVTPAPTEPPATPAATVAAKAPVAVVTAPYVNKQSAFDQKIEKVIASGSVREKAVVASMKQYLTAMKPGITMDYKSGVLHQQNLWRLIFNVVSNEESFEQCFGLLINFFREAKDEALHERYVFRFVEHLTIGSEAIAAFLAMVNLLKVTASTNNRKDVKKQVDIQRTMNSVYNEETRQRVQSYFS